MTRASRTATALRILTVLTTLGGTPLAHAQTVPEARIPGGSTGDPLVAQELSRDGSSFEVARVGLGLGAGAMGGGSSGIAFHGRLGLEVAPGRVVTVRAAVVEEFLLFGGTPERVWDAGILYGVQTRGKWTYASASAGLAMAGGIRRKDPIPQEPCTGFFLGCLFSSVEYTTEPFRTVGVAVEVDAGFTFLSGLGLAASGWANLNPSRSMAGFSLGLVLGDLR